MEGASQTGDVANPSVPFRQDVFVFSLLCPGSLRCPNEIQTDFVVFCGFAELVWRDFPRLLRGQFIGVPLLGRQSATAALFQHAQSNVQQFGVIAKKIARISRDKLQRMSATDRATPPGMTVIRSKKQLLPVLLVSPRNLIERNVA